MHSFQHYTQQITLQSWFSSAGNSTSFKDQKSRQQSVNFTINLYIESNTMNCSDLAYHGLLCFLSIKHNTEQAEDSVKLLQKENLS